MTVDAHTLTGAYAAHALTEAESAEFEAHLRDCPECQVEARELLATTARIGAGEYAVPSAELKAQVMAQVARTRQLPPSGLHANVVDLVDRVERRRSRLLLSVAAAVAAIAVVGGGVAGGIAYRTTQHSHTIEASDRIMAAVLSAPDARTIKGNGPGGSHGTAVVSDIQRAAVFTASGMPAASSGHVFQLWVIDTNGPHSAGVLTWHSDGSVTPVVSSSLPASGASFGVTVEPSGGSTRPTTSPIMLMPLRA